MKKRIFWLAILLLLGLADILVYRGYHLYYRAKDRTPGLDRRLTLLERGGRSVSPNDLLSNEAGRAYFEAGVNRLQRTESRDADFARSRKYFLRALALNPFSPTAHFDFAQVLQYMKALDLPAAEDFLIEYKNAARLSGTDHRVFGDVGKIMMSRWAELSEDDRRFMMDIGRAVLDKADSDTLDSYLEVWDLNIRDYAVLADLLPARPEALRRAARFLAEQSLDRRARLNFLIRAEALDYAAARENLQAGQNDLRDQRVSDAASHFREARKLLGGLRFFQNLVGKPEIDALEFRNVLRAALLGSAKCRVQETRRLEDAAADLKEYMFLEDRLGAIGELESFLKERGLIETTTTAAIHDFARYAFELDLTFRQSRYRDVVKAGQALDRSVLIITEEAKKGYARALEIIGDAYQRLDFLYESNSTYEKALVMGAEELSIRLKIRKNFERLNDPVGIKSMDEALARILSSREILPSARVINRGISWTSTPTLDARPYSLNIDLAGGPADPSPYLTVEANGHVLWDDYVAGTAVQVSLPAVAGPNPLQIVSLNRAVKIQKITLVPAGEALTDPALPSAKKARTSD